MFRILIGAILGVGLGAVTGLVPGVHANTLAGLMLATETAFISLLGPEVLAGVMFGALIAHSFLDIIPSTFLGMPDADTAITVLPAHALCLAGEGEAAIRLSALGSALGVVCAVPVALLFSIALPAVQSYLDWGIGVLLIGVAGYLIIVSDSAKWSFTVFCAAGLLGLFTFSYSFLAWHTIAGDSVLMPLLTGLFGISVLLFSSHAPIPAQHYRGLGCSSREIGTNSIVGTVAGSLVGWLPGLSNATANALLTPAVGYEERGRSYIIATSAANTANAILGLAALYALSRMRNGVMIAIAEHDLPPFSLLLLAGLVASIAAYLLTVILSRHAWIFSGMDAKKLSFVVIGTVTALSFILCGPFGLLVLALATCVGVLPELVNVRRVACMGAIMVPIILSSFNISLV